MSSDFVFIDPNKIPPRRSVKPVRSGRLKIKKISSKVWERDYEEPAEEEIIPEFNLLDSVLPENNIATEASIVDPLSQAIFSPEKVVFNTTPSFVLPQQAVKKEKTAEDLRVELLAEIESINAKDSELSKKINQFSSTSRSSPMYLASAPLFNKDFDDNNNLKINVAPRQDFNKNFGEIEEEKAIPFLAGAKKLSTERYRAESDWFQVSSAAPSRISELKKYYEKKDKRIFDTSASVSQVSKKEKSFNFKSLAGYLTAFLIPVSLVYFSATGQFSFAGFASGSESFVKSAIGGVNSKLLSTSSFTLVNSRESEIFPQLTDFKFEISEKGLGKELSDSIESFLQKNAEFSWFNIFKEKAANNVFSIKEIETLGKVKNALNTLSANNKGLTQLSSEFSNYLSVLAFWNQVLLPEKNYLIVVLNQDRSWPGGGEPKNYTVVSTNKNGLEIVSSGKFSELDAAFDLKVVPPDPVKVASTSWLPSQSFWFMDFKESSKTVSNFFENTSGKRIDGVIAINEDFLKDLSFKESLTLDTSSATWFYGFYDAFGRKPAGRWVSLANILNSGLSSHEVQLYFDDPALENFVEGSGWSTKTVAGQGNDSLGVSWASIKGAALNLELSEYRAQVFQDGSVMVKLSLMVRQNVGDESLNYLKVYLPKGFQVLKADGFSAKEKIPEFSYAAKGFSLDKRVGVYSSSKVGNIDLFEESESGVIGGWINLKRNERNTINLEYISSVKVSRNDGVGSYALKIIRPNQKENSPFRYVITPQDGVKITSLEPNGFVTQNMGEYQGGVSKDLNLISSFEFKK